MMIRVLKLCSFLLFVPLLSQVPRLEHKNVLPRIVLGDKNFEQEKQKIASVVQRQKMLFVGGATVATVGLAVTSVQQLVAVYLTLRALLGFDVCEIAPMEEKSRLIRFFEAALAVTAQVAGTVSGMTIAQKYMAYITSYYASEHPVDWFIAYYVPWEKSLEIIRICCEQRQRINLHKNRGKDIALVQHSIISCADRTMHQLQHLCAFLSYRAEMLTTPEQAAVQLILQSCATEINRWAEQMERGLTNTIPNWALLHAETVRLQEEIQEKLVLYKQNDLGKEFFRDLLQFQANS